MLQMLKYVITQRGIDSSKNIPDILVLLQFPTADIWLIQFQR